MDPTLERNLKRESREWWAIVDNEVVETIGYSCAPHNPNVWWCPGLGHSLSVGYHLFETKMEAINKLINVLNGKIHELMVARAKAEKQGDDLRADLTRVVENLAKRD